jgi:hypothetical protein
MPNLARVVQLEQAVIIRGDVHAGGIVVQHLPAGAEIPATGRASISPDSASAVQLVRVAPACGDPHTGDVVVQAQPSWAGITAAGCSGGLPDRATRQISIHRAAPTRARQSDRHWLCAFESDLLITEAKCLFRPAKKHPRICFGLAMQ